MGARWEHACGAQPPSQERAPCVLRVGLAGHCLNTAFGPAAMLQTDKYSCMCICLHACSLEQFCGRDIDEESSLIGGPTLLKFVSTFREARPDRLVPSLASAWPALAWGLSCRAPCQQLRRLAPPAAFGNPLPCPPCPCLHSCLCPLPAAGVVSRPAAHPDRGCAVRAPQPRLLQGYLRGQGKQAPPGQAQLRV